MAHQQAAAPGPPQIEQLSITNYRALRDVTFPKLASLTVLIGPNGGGKSTVFDVVAFLAECLTTGLRSACDKRNRLREMRSRGTAGPIVIEVKYREHRGAKLITYRLEVDDGPSGFPFVASERLHWTIAPGSGRPKRILDFAEGRGEVYDEETRQTRPERLTGRDVLAVSTLGNLERHPRVAALRRFISGWYLSYLTADDTRTTPMAGPQERLSQSGDNLPNVIQYLAEQHPERLREIERILAARVPGLSGIETRTLDDNRLLLRIKDAPFDDPVLARFASDGTLKMLAYLTVLYDPSPAPFVGIEEPENHLYPTLLAALAEEAHAAADRGQVLVTSHSPFFVNGLQPNEVWALSRADDGFTRLVRASDVELVRNLMAEGAKLGWLWSQGYLEIAEPRAVPGAS